MPLHLQSLDRDVQTDVPAQDPPRRGITIWWPGEVVKVKGRKARESVTVPMRLWQRRTIVFSALRKDHGDQPPKDAEEAIRMSLMAYALVASHDPVPSDATVFFEVVP